MNSKKPKEMQEQLYDDYIQLEDYCEELKNENTRVNIELEEKTQENLCLKNQILELKQLIAVLLDLKMPLDAKISNFISETIHENIELHNNNALNDDLPF